MQAAGGLISMTGEPGRPGVRVGSSLIDMGTGMWAALGIVSALLERERTGRGAMVDTSLYETALGYIGYHLVGYLADGTVPTGQGTMFPMVAPYQVFPTRDGELMVAGGNDRLFAVLCDVLGLPELVSDERFRTNPDRVRNREELVSIVSGRLAERDAAEWHRRLAAAGVPAAPVADVADIVSAEQTRALGMLQTIDHDRIPGPPAPRTPLVVRPGEGNARFGSSRGRGTHGADPRRSRLRQRRDRFARSRRRRASRVDRLGWSRHAPRVSVVQRDAAPATGRRARNVRPRGRGDRRAGGSLGAIDIVRVEPHHKIRDVTVSAANEEHLHSVADAVRTLDGIEVLRVSDRTFLMHLGGKIEMQSKVPLKTRDDLSMAYTPGVARISQAIADDPASALEPHRQAEHRRGRDRRDGRTRAWRHRPGGCHAGDGGEGRSLPGFGGVDALPICLATQDPDEIVAIVQGDRPEFWRDQP